MVVGKDKITVGIVTFNPEISRLREDLDSICGQADRVYIFDNGSNNFEVIRELLKVYDEKIALLGCEKNRGIAYALNRLCEIAICNGYKWMLTLDQDSVCSPNLVDKLLQYIKDDVAVVGPQIICRNNEKFIKKTNDKFEYVDWLITSASLTNLECFNTINGFDEWLFIDWVDYDYCIRAGRAGYKIIQVNDVQLLHELGKLQCRNVLGKVVYVTNHSSFRYFYMVRNSLYLAKKLGLKNMYAFLIKLFLKVLIWEPDKIEKLKAMFNGMMAYRKYSIESRL